MLRKLNPEGLCVEQREKVFPRHPLIILQMIQHFQNEGAGQWVATVPPALHKIIMSQGIHIIQLNSS